MVVPSLPHLQLHSGRRADGKPLAWLPIQSVMMASDPAEGRSASTQRSTVAGDAKPIVTMIECEAGHTRPDARAARATNSTDQQCPTARAVTSPGQSRIEAITPLGDKPIGAEPDTHMAHREVRIPKPNLLRTQQVNR